MDNSDIKCLEVDRSDLKHSRVVSLPENTLKDGEVLMSVDSFALTANNITYAVFGDAMQYWKFFPASAKGWGCVPVWGFGTVEESYHDQIEPGERFYGYFPMASGWVMHPERVSDHGFRDGVEHRDGLPEIYNRYVRISSDPAYRADFENQQLLFRPLFTTAFLLDQKLLRADEYGAEQVILSSASSKTAMALAWLLRQRGVDVIGVTSQAGRSFVKNSQNYKKTVLYDEVESEIPDVPSVSVDFAGSPEKLVRLHRKLGDKLKASILVGATDWEASGGGDGAEMPGPAPEFFFAPTMGEELSAEWGPPIFEQRVAERMLEFYEPASRWVKTVRGIGSEAVQECYDRVLRGKALPSDGFILSFQL